MVALTQEDGLFEMYLTEIPLGRERERTYTILRKVLSVLDQEKNVV